MRVMLVEFCYVWKLSVRIATTLDPRSTINSQFSKINIVASTIGYETCGQILLVAIYSKLIHFREQP